MPVTNAECDRDKHYVLFGLLATLFTVQQGRLKDEFGNLYILRIAFNFRTCTKNLFSGPSLTCKFLAIFLGFRNLFFFKRGK